MDLNQDVFVYNPLDKTVECKAFGNWFSFKPGQIKRMRPEIGHFLNSNKGYLGLVTVSEKFDDPSYAKSEDGIAELAEAKTVGISKRISHLQTQVNNLQVGLRSDLDTANIKADISVYATKGDLSAIDELLAYQRKQEDTAKADAEHARIGLARLKASQSGMLNKKAAEPAKEEDAPSKES